MLIQTFFPHSATTAELRIGDKVRPWPEVDVDATVVLILKREEGIDCVVAVAESVAHLPYPTQEAKHMKIGDRVSYDGDVGVIVARTQCEDGVDCLVAFVDPHIEFPGCNDVYVLRYYESCLTFVEDEQEDNPNGY
jgi:hypothetical protein